MGRGCPAGCGQMVLAVPVAKMRAVHVTNERYLQITKTRVQRPRRWGCWVALTILSITGTSWLAGAYVYHRDARKLLEEAQKAKHLDHAQIASRTTQADWKTALRWPFGTLE
jgi:hypothetical protein